MRCDKGSYFTVFCVHFQLILVLTSREQQQLASASGVAEEAFSAIRTVVAYGGEKVEADRCVRIRGVRSMYVS